MRKFSYQDYTLAQLIRLKKAKGVTVGIGLPVLNEAKTLPKTFKMIRDCGPLIDQVICVVDNSSKDKSMEVCRHNNIRAIFDSEVAKSTKVKLARGKGWNMWGGLYYLKTDIIVWIDTDIQNISPRFITGIIGPMIVDDKIDFVKGYYHRPKGDARVTEIMVRPFFSLLLPRMLDFIQPLSGEYGGRRTWLNKINFYSGYSIEVAMLIQAVTHLKPSQYGQSYLGKRIHKLQSVASLGKMSFAIMHTLLLMSRQLKLIQFNKIGKLLCRFSSATGNNFSAEHLAITDRILPPIADIQRKQK